ncbi:MAG TPA: hypothetical protein VLK84_08910 [Longimicrobium sp.]|nr:hypothetical protein [Longimicrobium sp.]
MQSYICTTCGTQFAPTAEKPAACPICEDERQYVAPGGQQWTTMDALRRGHRNSFRRLEPGLYGFAPEPKAGIGQRALLVRTPAGNVLWDCVPLLDDATVDIIRGLGGLSAIAISHPHFYTSMVEWAHAFDAPVFLHADDRESVMRPDPSLRFWEGETHALMDGLTLIRCGGHFSGSSVLHWAAGAEGRGALMTGDTIQVVPDRGWVTFMRSFPNQVPLNAAAVRRITAAVEPFAFDRIYGAWWDAHVETDAKDAVARSAARYLDAIAG